MGTIPGQNTGPDDVCDDRFVIDQEGGLLQELTLAGADADVLID